MKAHPFNLKEYALVTLGITLMSVGIYFFKFPNHFSTGGVSGLAIIIDGIIPAVTPGLLSFIINMLLLLVGYIVLGKAFGAKTTYATILFSVQLWLLEIIYPMTAPFTDEPLLELAFAVMLPAIGSAMLFNIDASSGGTDVMALILKKHTSVNIGQALLYSDLTICLATFPVFGIKVGLMSVFGLAIKTLIVDSVIESINLCKYFTIVTTHPDEISAFIVDTLHRGATLSDARGAFSHQSKTVVTTVVNRPQGVLLQRHIKEVDPDAFILITNTSEIIGKGFRGVL